jgi:hypothetical protein
LEVVKLLDQQSSILCGLLAPNSSELQVAVHRNLAQLQVRKGCTLFHDTSVRAEPSTWRWREFTGVVVAANYVEICSAMVKKYRGQKEEVILGYVINRMMRGLLWNIHNGNRPYDSTSDDRLLECSLSSRWLSDTSTLWID